jgi:hypothetical protein
VEAGTSGAAAPLSAALAERVGSAALRSDPHAARAHAMSAAAFCVVRR